MSAHNENHVAEQVSEPRSSKGYCYFESVPPLLVTNTDTYRPELPGAYEVYRQIEGSWYLVLEHGN